MDDRTGKSYRQIGWLPQGEEGAEPPKRFRWGKRKEAKPDPNARQGAQPETEINPLQLLDPYRVLGISPEADAEAVRRAYREKVRRYSPETQPEEFQAVRSAYETLNDPVERRNCDFERLHGDRFAKMMKQLTRHMGRGQTAKAVQLVEKMVALAPEQPELHCLLGILYLRGGDVERFHRAFAQGSECARSGGELVRVAVSQVEFLLEMGQAERAVAVVEKVAGKVSREEMVSLRVLGLGAYAGTKRWKDACAFVDRTLGPPERIGTDDVEMLIELANHLLENGRWDLAAKAKRRLEGALRGLRHQADRLEVKKRLGQEYLDWLRVVECRKAAFFADLGVVLDPRDEEARAAQHRMRRGVPVEDEIDRIAEDHSVFPLVQNQAFRAYFLWLEAEWDEKERGIPPKSLAELEAMEEDYAAGIARVKKKYPLLYGLNRAFWDEKLEELTSGMNRETRRGLGIR